MAARVVSVSTTRANVVRTQGLQKFVERGGFGEGPGRAAYVIDPTKLPEPSNGFEWRAVRGFMPGAAILADPGLKPVFEAALKRGCAVVAQAQSRELPDRELDED